MSASEPTPRRVIDARFRELNLARTIHPTWAYKQDASRRLHGVADLGLRAALHEAATMNSERTSPEEVASFSVALLQLFRGRTWADVEPFAERAWADFGCPETPWKEIESRVRAVWVNCHAVGPDGDLSE